MRKEILEILEKNKIYSDSKIITVTEEFEGEDDNGENVYFDVEFIREQISVIFNEEFVTNIREEILKEIWKKAQQEILKELWHTTSDLGQEKRYQLIYDKIVVKLNKLEKKN